MSITDLKELEDGRVSFTVTEDGKQWQEALRRVSAAMQKDKPIQGYRPGKASLEVAFQNYGQPMLDQAASQVLTEAMTSVCTEHDYSPVSNPKVETRQADLSALIVELSFAVYPKVADFDYVGIEVEKPVKTVTEEEVDTVITRYMKSHPWIHEVERGAQMGDVVDVSFTATCDGEPYEGEKAKKSHFILGRETLFAGLDEALVGHAAGEDLELTLTMPENFHRKAIQGKTLEVQVHIVNVSAREVLECTDDFVKEKVKGAETVEEFRKMQRDKLQKQNDRKSERAFEKNFQNKLISFVNCPIPQAMVSVSVNGFIRSLQQMCFQQGKSVKEVLAAEGKTMTDFIKQVTPSAVKQVKLSIALDYIMQKEQFEVTREAVEERVNTYMKQAKARSYETALKALGGEENVKEKLMNDMAVSFAREHCKVIEVEVDKL